MTSMADVEYTTSVNEDTGFEQECVYAVCEESGDEAGPVWGHGDASVRRVLAELTEECSCGATWHEANGTC